ncbi:MAG: hypothetical protein GXY38_03040, partial [Planctomycetes bacterium]|nr:hypothetical protein [Planctomycetota bacterium]
AYVEAIAGHLRPNGPNEGVIFDYEPWRVPYMDESFKPEIRAAFAKWAKLDHTPEAAELKGKLKRQWTDFWLDAGMSAYAAMAKAVRTHHPDPKTLLIAYTYFYDYGDEEKMYNQYWSCPKDPKLAERLYDVNLMGCYTKHDRELYDKVTLARKHLTKPMWAISSVSRVNPIQERYTKPYDSLSPQRLEQKIVQCAALGMERHGVWPGTGWIDGMHLAAMGNASRFIWAHEAFYFDGKRADDQLTVTPKAAFKEWCSTAHESGGRIMVTVFNFTDQSREFIIRARGAGETQTCKVAPRAYEAVMLER